MIGGKLGSRNYALAVVIVGYQPPFGLSRTVANLSHTYGVWCRGVGELPQVNQYTTAGLEGGTVTL